MKVVLASVSTAQPLTPQMRFLSLGYIHASAIGDPVIKAGTEIVHLFWDPSLLSLPEIAEAIAAEEPDLVGFTCYTWNAPEIFKICKELKDILPGVLIILGGPEVSYHYEKLLERHACIDYIGVGEGEHTFREFLRALVENRTQDIVGIAGLAQRRDGKPYLPAARLFEKELDKFPSPYITGVLDVCDIRGGANYQTVRGCPFVCTFCDYGRNQPYFEFSIERVTAEFKLFKKMDARILFNTDPTFNYSRKRAEAILQLGIDLDIKAVHWFEVFPTLVNDDLVKLVQDSHLSFIGCGIQTCTPQTMKNIRRVWNPEKVAPILDKLRHRKNIILSYEIIMGLPGDTVQDYKDTMSWTYSREPADIKSFNLAILPRTPLEKEVEKWDIEYDPNVYHEVVSTGTMNRQDVMVGRAINDWHTLLQNVFFRLYKATGMPAGDMIERWAWMVYKAGYHDQILSLRLHEIKGDLIEDLADLWERFVAELCAERGLADISKPFRDLLRYHFSRLSRTWVSTFFGHARDIFFNENYPELHQVYSVTETNLLPQDGTDRGEIPAFGADVYQRYFSYDMRDLFPCNTLEEIVAVRPKNMDYVFFMRPDTGAGCAVAIDERSHRFVELVDGRMSLAEISEAMAQGQALTAFAPRIHASMKSIGLFERPSFLKKHEPGDVTWQRRLSEAKRA